MRRFTQNFPPSMHRWLSLGEAASRLGVDEATLRHWADTGRIRTFRTPGGHRRFQEDDLQALIRRDTPRVEDLGHLVERRSVRVLAAAPARALHDRPWFASMDTAMRLKARERGRELFAQVVRFVAAPAGLQAGRESAARKVIRSKVLHLGQDYGRELQRAGLSPAEVAEAFGHFRHLVLTMVTEPRGRGGMVDEEQMRTLVNVSDLLDVVFHAMLRAWDRRRRGAVQ